MTGELDRIHLGSAMKIYAYSLPARLSDYLAMTTLYGEMLTGYEHLVRQAAKMY